MKRRLLEYEKLEVELGQLLDEYDKQADKIHQLEKGIGYSAMTSFHRNRATPQPHRK